jgi:hypothetical protein
MSEPTKSPADDHVRRVKAREQRYRNAAKRLHHEGGVLEVDSSAKVSVAFGLHFVPLGAYVQCWVWVDREEIQREDLG